MNPDPEPTVDTAIQAFVCEWWAIHGEAPVKAGDLALLPSADALLRPGARGHARSIQLGPIVTGLAGEVIGDRYVSHAPVRDTRNRARWYQLVDLPPRRQGDAPVARGFDDLQLDSLDGLTSE